MAEIGAQQPLKLGASVLEHALGPEAICEQKQKGVWVAKEQGKRGEWGRGWT